MASSSSSPSPPLAPSPLLLVALLLLATHVVITVTANRDALVTGINQLNSDVIELRDEIESSISNRCNSIRGCYKSSYDECRSEYTEDQHCPSFDETKYAVAECGSGKRCNGLFDTTISTVRMPRTVRDGANGNPTNPEVVEAICYSRTAERWMVKKYNKDKGLWRSLGAPSPQMYFGSATGVFRIFPARHSKECGEYDPRSRPWYKSSVPSTISNSVKPRNVVIVMDTSRSMNDIFNEETGETKLAYMKKAVAATVDGLTTKASIAVIRFGEHPQIVGRKGAMPPFMWRQATKTHKGQLIEEINGMVVGGRSNKVAALDFAFTLVKNSLRHAQSVEEHECELENIAFLFFSDGRYNMPDRITSDEVVGALRSNVEEVETMGEFYVHPFFYSIGKPYGIGKDMACAVDGYWAPVTKDIAPGNVTSGYQSYFSVPMGTDAFRNFTDWSAPYTFSASGELGYTVSSLVYNRDVEPAQFMGAVGMDISAEAARGLYGGTTEETISAMNEIIQESKLKNFNTTCSQQRINLTYCESQSMRYLIGGYEGICVPKAPSADLAAEMIAIDSDENGDITLDAVVDLANNATDENATAEVVPEDLLKPDEPEPLTDAEMKEAVFNRLLNCPKGIITPCAGYEEYPDNMWKNVKLKEKEYKDRVCCKVGENTQSSQCPKLDVVRDTKISDKAIFGIIFGSILFLELLGCYFCLHWRKKRNDSIESG